MRRIVVPFSDPQLDDTTIAVATRLATQLDARVTALLALTFLGYHPVLPDWETIIEQSRRDADRRIQDVRERLDALPRTGEGRPPLALRFRHGDEETHLRACALTHDLVLLVRRRLDAGGPMPVTGLMKSMLEASGRPIFIASGALASDFCDTVAIAWNGSVEAARSVTAALPLLHQAQDIRIVAFETARTSADDTDELLAYLDAHGLSARVLIDTVVGSVGEALLERCDRIGAGLLVMGAYTHSRLRQTLFGGVTHHILEHTRLPLLMAR